MLYLTMTYCRWQVAYVGNNSTITVTCTAQSRDGGSQFRTSNSAGQLITLLPCNPLWGWPVLR